MTEKKKPSLAGGVAAATLGTLQATLAPSRLLGYHNVFHGTSNLNAAKIKRRGLQPSKGGTGASKHVPDAKTFVAASKGKIHVTALKDVARDFAAIAQRNGNGKILKAKVSHRHWESMKADEHGAAGMKDISATTHHQIPSRQIKGGQGYKGARGVVNRNTLRAYYRSAPGRSRAGKGLLALAAGVAGNGYLAHVVKSRMEKKAAEKDNTTRNGVIGGAAAAALAPHASRRLLGYHVIQHGTAHQTAAKIKRKGFDPKRGGTGGAGEHAGGSEERKARFKRNSAGKIHVTKNPIMSRAFAGMTQSRKANPTAVDLMKGKVLKARVSHRHWEGMRPDADMNGQKWVAATTHHKIPAHQVIGGKGDKGIRGVVNKNTLRQYYANKANHGRIARGAVLAAGVAGGAYHAAKAVKKKFEKKASLSSLARTYLEA